MRALGQCSKVFVGNEREEECMSLFYVKEGAVMEKEKAMTVLGRCNIDNLPFR